VATSTGPLRPGRYFAALTAIVAVLYALVFFTGDSVTPKLGLDLQGGTTVTLRAETENGQAPAPRQLETARDIIANRVNGLGVAEAETVIEGDRNIVVSVPGQESEAARRVGTTAQLRFREVLQVEPSGPPPAQPTPSAPAGSATPAPTGSAPAATPPAATAPATPPAATPAPTASAPAASPTTQGRALSSALLAGGASPSAPAQPAQPAQPEQPEQPAQPDPAAPAATPPPAGAAGAPATPTPEALRAFAALDCSTPEGRRIGAQDEPVNQQAVACDEDGNKYLLDRAAVVGTDVDDANASLATNSVGNDWQVNLSFDGKGQDRWTDLTERTVQRQVAIVLDGEVVSAPQIQSVITGDAQITGNFTQEEATNLANILRYGALPLRFTTADVVTISPTLGVDQLRAGLLAGGVGLGLVVLYSLLYYRALGLVTVASLVLSGVIVYATLVLLGRQLGFTLSLAGVAGFIVAVGITADSFVVFFERLKEEVHEGRSMRSAVPRAWVRARRTILSADAVSFLAAAVLYVLSIGAVKGFAFTLGLSTIIDVLIVFLFTHPLVAVLSRSRTFASERFSGLGRVQTHVADARLAARAVPGERPGAVALGASGARARAAARRTPVPSGGSSARSSEES